MTCIILLLFGLGVAPFAVGAFRLARAPAEPAWPSGGSVLLCALAFNLTFFWQELWLVLPKAATPGLRPVLYNNDHSWSGRSPIVELLQGTGALATLISGIVALMLLAAWRRSGPMGRMFVFWMAFQGLFQGLSQFAVGALVPRNDVGRALTYLGATPTEKGLVLATVAIGMALAGVSLARHRTAVVSGGRPTAKGGFAIAMAVTMALCVLLAVPFREPRNLVEVALVPVLIDTIGAGWLVLGASWVRDTQPNRTHRVGSAWPAAALVLLLLFFQLVLRRGVAF